MHLFNLSQRRKYRIQNLKKTHEKQWKRIVYLFWNFREAKKLLLLFSNDVGLKITAEYARKRQPHLQSHDLDFLHERPKPDDDSEKAMRNVLELSKRYELTMTSRWWF